MSWKPIESAPRDGSLFLVDQGFVGVASMVAFRWLGPEDEDGICEDKGCWVVVLGHADTEGPAPGTMTVADPLAKDWRWREMPRVKEI